MEKIMLNNYSALILAAGIGKRMKSDQPKVLSEICGKALLEHIIASVEASGISRIGIVTGFKGDTVREKIGSKYAYYDQPQQLGTAHAVQCAADFVQGCEGTLLILCGDAPLIDAETIRDFAAYYEANDLSLGVLTAELDDPLSYGRIVRTDGKLKKITEKKDCSEAELAIGEVNSGTYLFDAEKLAETLKEISCENNQCEYYLTDTLELFLKKKYKADAFICNNKDIVRGVNDCIDLSACERIMREKINRKHMSEGVRMIDPASTYIDAGVSIGKGCVIYPNTFVTSGSIIGENNVIIASRIHASIIGNNNTVDTSTIEEASVADHCRIGPYAHLRPHTQIKDGVKLGNFVEIKNSVIGEKSSVAHLTYIGDGDVGKRVNFGCGVVFANYDGKIKYRTAVDDDSFIGCNTNLIAPVKIGKRVLVAAGSTITKDLEDDTFAIARCKETIKQRKQ